MSNCSSPEARYTVLGERPHGLQGPVLCLGPVGVDTSASINDITPDECLVRDSDGEDDVDGSGDDYRVRDQIADCADAGAGAATEAFSWGLEHQELVDHEKAVCLVPATTAS